MNGIILKLKLPYPYAENYVSNKAKAQSTTICGFFKL